MPTRLIFAYLLVAAIAGVAVVLAVRVRSAARRKRRELDRPIRIAVKD
jgi:hypothetical protein